MSLDYDKDLTIDPQALDVEWLRQPRLYMRYAEQLANAREYLSRASERLDITRAEAGNKARENFAAAGTKTTVDMVRDAAQNDPDVKADSDAVIKAEHEVNILQAAVRAFDQRKDALENMVRLHGQMYFAGPSVPRDIGKEFAAHNSEDAQSISVREGIAKRMRSTPSQDENTGAPARRRN